MADQALNSPGLRSRFVDGQIQKRQWPFDPEGSSPSSQRSARLRSPLEAEQERAAAQDQNQQLLEQRERFLLTLSHELRNQVSPIMLAVRLLEGQCLDGSGNLKEGMAVRLARFS